MIQRVFEFRRVDGHTADAAQQGGILAAQPGFDGLGGEGLDLAEQARAAGSALTTCATRRPYSSTSPRSTASPSRPSRIVASGDVSIEFFTPVVS